MPTTAELKKFGFNIEEVAEQTRGQYMKTGFPNPARRYRLHYEAIIFLLKSRISGFCIT